MAVVTGTLTVTCTSTAEFNAAKAYFDDRIASVGDVVSYTTVLLVINVITAYPTWTPPEA